MGAMIPYFVNVGVDIGQKSDPTAICVAEETKWGNDPHRKKYLIRHLERRPLQEDYPAVVERIRQIVDNVITLLCRESARYKLATPDARRSLFERDTWVSVDATGVGRPVVDLLRHQFRYTNVFIQAATFSFGDKYSGQRRRDREVSIGKAYLVSRLQVLLQTDRIKLPQTAEAQALAQELQDYEIKIDPDGQDKYGAFKTGAHDDLVTALGLATIDDHVLATVYIAY